MIDKNTNKIGLAITKSKFIKTQENGRATVPDGIYTEVLKLIADEVGTG